MRPVPNPRSPSPAAPQPRSFADIDEHNLDRESVHQPRLMLEKRDALAEANKDVLEAKAALEAAEKDQSLAVQVAKAAVARAEAELQLSIRRAPNAHGLGDKLTEKLVEAAVLAHPKYQEAQAEAFPV